MTTTMMWAMKELEIFPQIQLRCFFSSPVHPTVEGKLNWEWVYCRDEVTLAFPQQSLKSSEMRHLFGHEGMYDEKRPNKGRFWNVLHARPENTSSNLFSLNLFHIVSRNFQFSFISSGLFERQQNDGWQKIEKNWNSMYDGMLIHENFHPAHKTRRKHEKRLFNLFL